MSFGEYGKNYDGSSFYLLFIIMELEQKQRQQQYAIMNYERESIQTEEEVWKKLTTLQQSQWLFYSVYKRWLDLCKIYWK